MTASEKRARAPSMDHIDRMDQDSPQSSTASSYNNYNSNNNNSINTGQSSASTSTAHTTGTTPATLPGAPAGTPTTTAGAVQAGDSSSTASTTPNAAHPPVHRPGSAASKRRRGLGVVTPNACTECRKKRAKCDGQRPCGRCKAQKDVECIYEVPVRQSKETLRSELEQLRRQQRSSESVLGALARNEQWEEVLRRLRSGQSIESISEWLNGQLSSAAAGTMPSFARPPPVRGNLTPLATFNGASTHSYTPGLGAGGATVSPTSTVHPLSARQDVGPTSPWGTQFSTTAGSQALSTGSTSHRGSLSWTSGPPQTRVGSWVEDNVSQMDSSDAQRYRGVDQVLAPDLPPAMGLATTWTEVSHDEGLVQHLLALYFCWEYPTFASLSKEHFLKDFQAGRHRYCSPILVNALLALGCRFSSQPSTLANPNDPYSSGDHFFKESQRLFYREENHHSLTTIQALGIMSIREASCGRDSESWYYAGQSIRLAVEMGLHRINENSGDSDEVAVQAATFWGAFALDQ
ncbi:Conidial development protein fluffy [Cytospora mali]|uniref:Conidial development protein fluffy n=1 Tax=Cytospora mali TaxID=578113 RepID=A0A194UR80_CYTMA|nr:Conidial development protein fluffy [Valsa mali var. pyri (nom. inval.)]